MHRRIPVSVVAKHEVRDALLAIFPNKTEEIHRHVDPGEHLGLITRHQAPTFLLIPVGKLRVETNIMSAECCGCMYYGKFGVCIYLAHISP